MIESRYYYYMTQIPQLPQMASHSWFKPPETERAIIDLCLGIHWKCWGRYYRFLINIFRGIKMGDTLNGT